MITLCEGMPLARMRSRMKRSRAIMLVACLKLNRDIQSSSRVTNEPGRSQPAAMASSGLKSMTQ